MSSLIDKLLKIESIYVSANSEAALILSEIQKLLLNLPDNELITRHGCGYTISKKNLGTDSWAPEHNDFRLQYESIIHALNEVPIEQTVRKLESILENEEVKVKKAGFPLIGWPGYGDAPKVNTISIIKINPVVLRNIKALLTPSTKVEGTEL